MPRDVRWQQELEDDDDFYDWCDCEFCRPPPDDGPSALQELVEAVRPTTMALALTRAGVIDDAIE